MNVVDIKEKFTGGAVEERDLKHGVAGVLHEDYGMWESVGTGDEAEQSHSRKGQHEPPTRPRLREVLRAAAETGGSPEYSQGRIEIYVEVLHRIAKRLGQVNMSGSGQRVLGYRKGINGRMRKRVPSCTATLGSDGMGG